MLWHIHSYGPTPELKLPKDTPILSIFFQELWHMIVGGHGFLAEIGDIWLYFLFGIVLAGYIRTYKFHIRLRKTLIKHGFISIFIAALIGVFSPLCSCGILATAIGLLSTGLPLAPAMALLIASPLMSPTAFFLTISDLGVEWTAIRVLVAFLMGIFAGVLTHLIRNFGFETETLFIDGGIPEGDFHDHDYEDERLRCTCNEKFSNKTARKVKNHSNPTVVKWQNFIIFCCKTIEMTWMVGKYVLVGIFVGVVAENYIPQGFINNLFGTSGPMGVIYVTLGSIPIFLHQISASSILYHIKEALPGTMDPGAGLAFLIGGPVTALPAMTLLWAMFKKRVFVLYLFISIFGTLLFAYSFRAFVFVPNVDSNNPILLAVSSLPAGKASVMKKEGEYSEYVHIAANPNGNNLMATYEDLEGGSGIVFDAGLERFSNGNADVPDNRQYLLNIARYLDETSMGSAQKSILIYNTFAKSGLSNDQFDRNAPVVLAENSYNVKITDRAQNPTISPELLSEYNQLWILSGESDSSTFSKEEITTILDYRDEGNSLLITAGPNEGPQRDLTRDATQIASNFGVKFYGMVDHGREFPVSILGTFFSRLGEKMIGYFDVMKEIRDSD
jgi:uncharacterized membrane protein YraQ (UPF0718 family)